MTIVVELRAVAATLLVALALVASLAAAVGQVKARAAIARLHLGAPAAVAATPLVALALVVAPDVDNQVRVTAALTALVALVSSSVVSHALARAAHHRAHPHQEKETRA